LFRSQIDVDFIARIYLYGINGIKDQTVFPLTNFSKNDLMLNYLEYHLRGIATEKGINELERQLINT
jgi:transcriptional regulator, TetR family